MSRNKILVIDTDPVIRSGICDFLTQHGHIVAQAVNTHDAHVQFEKFRPDAAILDFSFANGDALHLLQRIKSTDSNIPVIVLTGQSSLDLAVRAIQEGAEQFLIKPVDLSALMPFYCGPSPTSDIASNLWPPVRGLNENVSTHFWEAAQPFAGWKPSPGVC